MLLALYVFGQQSGFDAGDKKEIPVDRDTQVFSMLVGVAFSLWRAAFLAEMPTRTWPEALRDAQQLLGTVLSTNTIAFGTEHSLQGWTGGYYLNNAKLRLMEVGRRLRADGRSTDADVARLDGISLMNTNPHDTWRLLCDEAERLTEQISGAAVR